MNGHISPKTTGNYLAPKSKPQKWKSASTYVLLSTNSVVRFNFFLHFFDKKKKSSIKHNLLNRIFRKNNAHKNNHCVFHQANLNCFNSFTVDSKVLQALETRSTDKLAKDFLKREKVKIASSNSTPNKWLQSITGRIKRKTSTLTRKLKHSYWFFYNKIFNILILHKLHKLRLKLTILKIFNLNSKIQRAKAVFQC